MPIDALTDISGGARNIRIPFADGGLACVVRGSGPPVLLIHSINAAPSTCEMAALAERLARTNEVYSVDLPGFGQSPRPDAQYTIGRFVSAVDATVGEILREANTDSLHAAALSLSCEFLARSAHRNPHRYRSLTLISPTGFQKGGEKLVEPEGRTFVKPWLARWLSRPWIGKPLYGALTHPASIRFFLRRTFGRPDVDDRVFRCAVANARAEGARFAPLAFISGALFSRDIQTVYRSIKQPIWMPHGTRGSFSDFSAADWAREARNWRVDAFRTGAMPHVELPEEFAEAMRRHMAVAAVATVGDGYG